MNRTNAEYEVIVVGGGVGGSALAYRLATAGVRVLVLEQSRSFRDRVRGDVMYPWGVAAARTMGLLKLMLDGGARHLPYWRTRFAGFPAPPPRVLEQEVGESALAFFHPELQTTLLEAAAGAGAEVVRGARATGLARVAGRPLVQYSLGGSERTASASLVVGADGRNSAVSRWAGFARRQDEPRLVFGGVLLEGVRVEYTEQPADTNQLYFNPPEGLLAMLLPVDEHRTRVYAGYHLDTGRMPQVGVELAAFLALAGRAGVPAGALAGTTKDGPLAAFEGADNWAPEPYSEGVALLGDAAATSDPSFGSGMALTMLSARLLADALLGRGGLGDENVDAAGRQYAQEFAHAYGSLRRQIDWLTEFYRTPGPQADALRAERYPLHAAEPWRVPDVVGVGPAGPSDEAAKTAFLGPDEP